MACLHRVSTKTISVKYVVHILLIRYDRIGTMVPKGFQLNNVKEVDSIIDAGGSDLLGQDKVR